MCSSCRRSPARRRKRWLGRRRSCPSSGEASRPPHPLLDVLLLGNSVADLFRAFTSIGPADHGKDASLAGWAERSEEHTSELQSRFDLVCRLLLEKKKYTYHYPHH